MTLEEIEEAAAVAVQVKENARVQYVAAKEALAVARTELQQADMAWLHAQLALYQARVETLAPIAPAIRVLVEGRSDYTRAIAVEVIVSATIFEGRITDKMREDFGPPQWGPRERFSTARGYARCDLERWIARAKNEALPART